MTWRQFLRTQVSVIQLLRTVATRLRPLGRNQSVRDPTAAPGRGRLMRENRLCVYLHRDVHGGSRPCRECGGPFGSFEQHGSHLPLSTDTASVIARRVQRTTNCSYCRRSQISCSQEHVALLN
jgi:hypothetical protein